MKRTLAALLAALLLISLAACDRETPPDPEQPETPVVQEPEETPETPDDEAPEPPTETPDPVEPADDGAAVTDNVVSGSVEELIGYQLTMPQVDTGDQAVDQILNDYYTAAAGQLEDLCWGEVYEQALENLQAHNVTAQYTVERNGDGVLSIYRTVTVENLVTGDRQQTAHAETFQLSSGGLLTAADFFDADEATWTARLVEQVRRAISDDPYHDQSYYPQWSDLCASAFQREQFYVTDEAFVVFYQPGDLGPGGQTTFAVPWSSLSDIAA